MSSAYGPQKTFTSVAATMKQTGARALMAGLLIAALMTAAISFAALAAAKGQEGGVVCTGTQMTSGTCQPTALQATPIAEIPLGCKPSSHDSVACGRLGSHETAAAAAQSAGRLHMVQQRRLPRRSGSIRTSRPAPSPRPAATQRAKQEQGGGHAKGLSSVVHSSGRLAMGEKEANTRHPLDAHPMGPPQAGQAPSPWVRKTFRATAICSSRLAAAGDPTPPLAAQVLGLNCRPP